jgi:hypothetical protein
MAHAASDQARVERHSDRRGIDRRVEQQLIAGVDRREADRRSGKDRRDS